MGLGIIAVVILYLFAIGVKAPGGVQDKVSKTIINAPTQAEAEKVFWSSSLILIVVFVAIVAFALMAMGGIVAESESRNPLMNVYRDAYGVPRLEEQSPPEELPTEMQIVVIPYGSEPQQLQPDVLPTEIPIVTLP